MGRTREFENDVVLDRAGELFWRLGYDVVSVQQLESATGLGRGSLYNAFGDKEGLFLAALDRYVAKHGAASFRHLRGRDVGRGIRRMLDAIIARMSDPSLPRGCLLVNASLAFGAGSRRIDAAVAERVKAMETVLRKAIARARDDGQIPADADPQQLARFYCAVVHSLGVAHRAMGDAAALRDVAAVAMRGWPGPNRRRRVTARRWTSGESAADRRRP
jgi:TetR/AcrR family transcriptional repressor of nem operon